MNLKTCIPGIFVWLLFLTASDCIAQKQTLIGINGNVSADWTYPRPSIGITFDHRLSKHSGFETGIFYRTRKPGGTTTYIDSTGYHAFSFSLSERHLYLPILYKYHSKILDLSTGPLLDLYIGWRQKSSSPGLVISNYNVASKLRFGWQVKASRMISLDKHFIVEPELRYTMIQRLGIGLALKYKLKPTTSFNLH